MKKIILSTFLLCLISSVCFADFLEDNPGRYEKMPATEFFDTYLDKYSVKLIRKDFPFYVIQYDTYTKSYTSKYINKTISRYFYDYNEQKIDCELIHVLSLYQEDGTEVVKKYIDKDGTIKYKDVGNDVNPPIIKIHDEATGYTSCSNGYIEANAVFYCIYHRWFSKDFLEKVKKHNENILNGTYS